MYNEHMPDCVPEFYRARQEEADRQYEKQCQQGERYSKNREKLKAVEEAGLPILRYGGYGPCWECETCDHDTQRDADDDFCLVICHNPDCPHHKKQRVTLKEKAAKILRSMAWRLQTLRWNHTM